MNSLRWILLAAGVVLLMGIVLWDRMRRPASRPDERMRSDERPRSIPQLDEAINVRPRAREHAPPPVVATVDMQLDSDDLPPIHAVGRPSSDVRREDTSHHSNAPLARMTQARPEPVVDRLSTGAFIAAQAMSTQSMRAAMHQAHREPALDDELAAHQAIQPITVVETNTVGNAVQVTETAATAASTVRMAKRPPSSRKIVALRLSAGPSKVEGARLKSLLEEAGLRYGKYGIYHRLTDDGSTLFSVASMVEPGTFDPYAMAGVQFPGVTLFMQLPGHIAGDAMFTQLLACARHIETAIGGQLRDERGVVLDEQRERHMRDEIADFEHLLGRTHD